MSGAGSRIFPATGHKQNAKRDGGDQFFLNHFVSRGFANSTISFAYGSRISPLNQAPDCIWPARQTIFLFPCRSLWISATCAIFSQSPKLVASAARLTGSEFPNRVFLNRCEIWRRIFAYLFFSAVENGFCLRREV